ASTPTTAFMLTKQNDRNSSPNASQVSPKTSGEPSSEAWRLTVKIAPNLLKPSGKSSIGRAATPEKLFWLCWYYWRWRVEPITSAIQYRSQSSQKSKYEVT